MHANGFQRESSFPLVKFLFFFVLVQRKRGTRVNFVSEHANSTRVEACGAIFAPWVGNRTVARLNLFIEINYYSNNYLNNSVIERWINKLIFIWYLLDIDHLILFTKKENIEIIKIFMVILNENCISFFLSSIIIWDNILLINHL